MIRIAIADDHQMVIDGLQLILQGHSDDIEVVGTSNDGTGLLDILGQDQIDIVILDISMPGMEDAALLKLIRKKYKRTKVLMLTMHKDARNISTMIQLGAKGYIVKNRGGKEAVNAIISIARGETYFSQDVQEAMMLSMMPENQPTDHEETKKDPVKITPQESRILELLAEDLSEKQIADKLCISTKTVEAHKKNLKVKVGANSEKGLVRFAVENNFIRSSRK